jgi:hypothetical protein
MIEKIFEHIAILACLCIDLYYGAIIKFIQFKNYLSKNT